MTDVEIVKAIVQDSEILDMPPQYITAASYRDELDMEQVIMGDELDDFLEKRPPVGNINFLIDMASLTTDIRLEYTQLMNKINAAAHD